MTSPQPILGWLDWAADLSPLPDFLLKATALLLVGWFTALMPRGRNPHWRVLLWRCVVASLVCCPRFPGWPPRFRWWSRDRWRKTCRDRRSSPRLPRKSCRPAPPGPSSRCHTPRKDFLPWPPVPSSTSPSICELSRIPRPPCRRPESSLGNRWSKRTRVLESGLGCGELAPYSWFSACSGHTGESAPNRRLTNPIPKPPLKAQDPPLRRIG